MANINLHWFEEISERLNIDICLDLTDITFQPRIRKKSRLCFVRIIKQKQTHFREILLSPDFSYPMNSLYSTSQVQVTSRVHSFWYQLTYLSIILYEIIKGFFCLFFTSNDNRCSVYPLYISTVCRLKSFRQSDATMSAFI